MIASEEQKHLSAAISLARENVDRGGRPFGAVVVKDGKVIATGVNDVVATNDPTAHAELQAIRAASRNLKSPDLSGCYFYASGHPCPMCMAAMRMAGIDGVVFCYSNEQAEPFGLSTGEVYADLARPFPEQSMRIRHVPLSDEREPAIYLAWQKRQQSRF